MSLRERWRNRPRFPEPTGPGWLPTPAPCPARLSTYSADHVCGERGVHWQHECADPDCRFRWLS